VICQEQKGNTQCRIIAYCSTYYSHFCWICSVLFGYDDHSTSPRIRH